jgi:hypothetical protein
MRGTATANGNNPVKALWILFKTPSPCAPQEDTWNRHVQQLVKIHTVAEIRDNQFYAWQEKRGKIIFTTGVVG